MAIVGITFKGPQGSGKSILLLKIAEYLRKEGFNIIAFEEIHGINVIDPIETLQKEKD